MATLRCKYGEGYGERNPFPQGDYLSPNEAYGALCGSLEYLIGQNLSTLLSEYNTNQFADLCFTTKQLEIIQTLYDSHKQSFGTQHYSPEKPDIYLRTERLMFLNKNPRVAPTATLPINGIRILNEPAILVDYSPRQKKG